jgi:hypothetical protein
MVSSGVTPDSAAIPANHNFAAKILLRHSGKTDISILITDAEFY